LRRIGKGRKEMKIYRGIRIDNGVKAVVEVLNDDSIRTYDLPHKVRHSPTGFEYGYGGSGPSEFARCILLDMDYPENEVDRWYQDFKRWFIERADRSKDLEISEDAVQLWWEGKNEGNNVT